MCVINREVTYALKDSSLQYGYLSIVHIVKVIDSGKRHILMLVTIWRKTRGASLE